MAISEGLIAEEKLQRNARATVACGRLQGRISSPFRIIGYTREEDQRLTTHVADIVRDIVPDSLMLVKASNTWRSITWASPFGTHIQITQWVSVPASVQQVLVHVLMAQCGLLSGQRD